MEQFFFKINLNKTGELKQKAEVERRTFKFTAIGYALILVIMIGFIIGFNLSMKAKINNRSLLLNKIRDEIKSYQVSGDFLSKEDLTRLAEISTERIFWAKKLVAFSEKTTDKIAITHFSFKNNKLSIYGITQMNKDEKEYDLIDDFITELKNNKHIYTDFSDISFVSSRRDFEKDVEILRFQIDCESGSSRGGRK